MKNYLNSNYSINRGFSLKRKVATLLAFFLMAFSFAQQTATITTTSNDPNWIVTFLNLGGLSLDWVAIGPGINQTGSGDNPTFDFSANAGNGLITITITSNDNFAFTTQFLAPARDIETVDLSNVINLSLLEMPNNAIAAIDLSTNTLLQELILDSNALTSLDLAANTALTKLEVHNNGLTTLDLSTNTLLQELDANNNDLTSINLTSNVSLAVLNLSSNDLNAIDISSNALLSYINLDFNLLNSNSIGQVLNDVDAYGTGTFGYVLRLQGNPGTIPASAIPAYNNLLSRNWTIVPPVYYDFGDAPNSYSTDLLSGGAQHIIGAGVPDIKIGFVVDDEIDSFDSINADGDDLDNVNDEDGVETTDLEGILTSTDNFSATIDVTNNFTAATNLYAWIDFDGNGTFDVDEFTTVSVPNAGAALATLTWSNLIANGVDIVEGDTYARFRITMDALDGTQPGGVVSNGEVEDYTLTIMLDTDFDGVPDVTDEDDDNDGIIDTDEENGDINRDTDGDGALDRVDWDADGDGCVDVDEAGFENNGNDMLGNANPPIVDPVTGLVTSATDGYTAPNDLDGNGTPDFQEAGIAATITTERADQIFLFGDSTFSVVAVADTYQWQVSTDSGANWADLTDVVGEYSGTDTADLVVTNALGDITKLTYLFRVIVNNIAFACDPTTTSVEVTYIMPDDTDNDGVYDIVDEDDDNDGITDTDEGDVDTTGDGIPDVFIDSDGDGLRDSIELDADDDGCPDVTEAGFENNGTDMLGNASPPTVDPITGLVTSATDGYTAPNDLDGNGTPDFQEVGAAATITTQPVDQMFTFGDTTFSTVAVADTYQWEVSTDGGANWLPLSDVVGEYSGTDTADLVVTNTDLTKLTYMFHVIVNNIAFACDPTTISDNVRYLTPDDTDNDGVIDLVDEDDDNDGITDADEGDVDTTGDGIPDVFIDSDGDGLRDSIELDADDDGCPDVTEAGFENNGTDMLGNASPPIVDPVTGLVTSATDGYTPPNDLDGSGTPDYREAGAAASITVNPADQLFVLGGSATFSLVSTGDTFQWEESLDGGANWADVVDGGDYSGALTPDLTVSNLVIGDYTNMYRVRVNSIAYACDPVTTSLDATFVNNLVDTDNDGVFDLVDEDDDNDGILDSDEGDATDSNGNGIFDRLELDADADGCNDVTEAGYTDGDGDGILGTSPVIVDPVTGLITDDANGPIGDGFTTPNDLDLNGIYDFQEAGTATTITTQPQDDAVALGDDAMFTVVGTSTFYQWQESTDNGSNWNDIVDAGIYSGATTSTLTITAPPELMSGYVYRVQLRSPDFVCDPNPVLNSAGALLLINVLDWDNDGVYDINDTDDDNDGITDVNEYDGLPPLGDSDDPFGPEYDIDGDGIPNQFDNDSDGDNCTDVTEAGFTDNGFGMLGTLNPPNVDGNGMVTSSTDGYTPPNDLDNNGVLDFREAGTAATITVQPVDQDFELGNSATFSVVATGDTYQWEVTTDGVNWSALSDVGNYSGTTTPDLTVSNLTINLYTDFYRVRVSNIAYACDPTIVSSTVTYNDLEDTDNDGVYDIVDVDDDNDGIYDSVEGEFTDSNLDGTPDRISLDADGDTCADVLEAGFDDPDGDGILGSSPVTVDADGMVTGQGGYTTPNDLDLNGIFDFQEAGSASEITNQPEDTEITLGTDATFEVVGDATFYQWEISLDGGSSWTALVNGDGFDSFDGVNTNRLRVNEAYGMLESSLYRVIMTSPDFACDPIPMLISDAAMLSFNTELIPSGFSPNGDGANDLFDIPGLDQYPNFKLDIFNRWGSKVYSYSNNGSTNPEWWDGISTGSMTVGDGRVPVGSYFYALYFNGDGESPKSGWVYVNY